MNCTVSNDSFYDYGDCEGSIYELKVPQLYPSVRRDDTVRKLHVCCINKHLNHNYSGLFTCRKSTDMEYTEESLHTIFVSIL